MNQLTHKRVFADIPISSYATVESTQLIAVEALESKLAGLELNTEQSIPGQIIGVFTAMHQSEGKGRRGRVWVSKPGSSVLATYVIRKGDINSWQNVAKLIVSNIRALKEYGIPVLIKWPNDFVIDNGQKLGGCLTQVVGDFLCVGIGINLEENAYGDELGNIACSVRDFNVEINTDTYIDSVINNYMCDFDVLSEYLLYSHTIDKDVEIEQVSRKLLGKAIDIQADGTLVLESDSGEIYRVVEGDVIHARINS